MNWYNKSQEINRLSGKTYRDDKNIMTLYHVSPNNLTALRPLSKFEKYTGLFMSPSYKSLIRDWAGYVMGKKHNTDLDIKRKEILRETDRIEGIDGQYKKAHNPEEQAKLDELYRELDKIDESMSSEGYRAATKGYGRVYVHKILCPKEIYEDCVRIFNEVYDSGYMSGAFGFWAWGAQIFVPAEYLKYLKIISVRSMTRDDFYKEYKSLGMGTDRRRSTKLTPQQQQEFDAEEQRRKSETPEETKIRLQKEEDDKYRKKSKFLERLQGETLELGTLKSL